MSIRILLGAEDNAIVGAIRAQILELPDCELVGVEPTSVDVVNAVASFPDLDVVLIHHGISGLPAMELIRELTQRFPQLAVILIADETGAETFGAAMTVGARGVVSREPTFAELENRIGAAAEWSRTMRRLFKGPDGVPPDRQGGRLLAVCGAKGGTGTTTLAVHLAFAAAAARVSVCLVDMDLQKGDIPSYLDVAHRRSVVDLVPAADDLDGSILAESLFIYPDGPHVLLAPADGERAEEITPKAARQILAALRTRYEIVVVDCGAFLTDGSATAVEVADTVLVTATPDLPSLRAIRRLVALWARLQLRKEDDLSVVLIRQDKKSEVQPAFVRKLLGLQVLNATIPAAFRGLETAVNAGLPREVESSDFRKAIDQVALETGLVPAGALPAQRRGGRDRGAVTIEFGAVLPLVGLLLLVVYQFMLVGLTSMYASHGANEAARAASVLGYDTPDARKRVHDRAVARISGHWKDDATVEVAGDFATVTVPTPFVLPGWHSPFRISAHARVVREGAP